MPAATSGQRRMEEPPSRHDVPNRWCSRARCGRARYRPGPCVQARTVRVWQEPPRSLGDAGPRRARARPAPGGPRCTNAPPAPDPPQPGDDARPRPRAVFRQRPQYPRHPRRADSARPAARRRHPDPEPIGRHWEADGEGIQHLVQRRTGEHWQHRDRGSAQLRGHVGRAIDKLCAGPRQRVAQRGRGPDAGDPGSRAGDRWRTWGKTSAARNSAV